MRSEIFVGWRLLLLLLGMFASTSMRVGAQELTPRTYSNAPMGLNFLGIVYAFSHGNVLLDPVLPIEGLTSDLHIVGLRYVRTFDLFGVSNKFKAFVPLTAGHWEGTLTEALPGTEIEAGFQTRDATGFGDARFGWEINFLGAPALALREFADYRPRTVAGASIHVVAPTGQYDSERLINLGSNRWGFRLETGISRTIRRWTFELMVTAWLYTANDNFFGGSKLEQDSIVALKGHIIYTLRPGLWIAFNTGFLDGGATRINGVLRNTLQRNSRAGLTLVVPLARRYGLSVSYTSGVTKSVGADFNTFAMGFQYMWGQGFP